MTVLDTLNFVAFNPLQNNNPIAVRRRKLMAKIDEQIQLATNKDYTPTQHKWVTDGEGKHTKVEVAKRVKRWWTASVDGKINLVVRYGSKPLEFAKGKNAIELGSEAEVAEVLAKVREAAENGELDALIEQQAQFGRRVTQNMAMFTSILVSLAHVGLSEAWPIVLIAGAYLLGVQGITAAIHIPLNNHIQKVKIEDLDNQTLADVRLKFEAKWNFFNYVRTGIALSVSLLLLIILSLR